MHDTQSPPEALPEADEASNARETVQSWQRAANDQLDVARSWIRRNPLPALGIALASGFLIGRMLRR